MNFNLLKMFYILLTTLLCMASLVQADYWRFTLNNYQCIEPREWKTDHVYFRMDIITGVQGGAVEKM